jgi:hypothetical protein
VVEHVDRVETVSPPEAPARAAPVAQKSVNE